MFKHERSKTIAPARYSENKIPKQKPLPQNHLLDFKINIGISMSDLEEITKDSGYDAEASGASKATIFTFIGTFVACLFLFENTAGLISGATFVIVGMFVASLLISAPLFLLKKKYPGASILFGLLDVVITIFATVMVFSYFFTNPMDFATAAAPGDDSNPYVLRCNEAIPEFTLSGTVTPSTEQVNQICGCIWREMSPWAKEVSTAVANGQEDQVSENQIRAFISHMGQKIETCNTENL